MAHSNRTSTPFRIPSIDGIRAISIALVLIGHASRTTGFPWRNWRFDSLANAGVRIFFVLSGFLITTLLLKEQQRDGKISLGDFYLRRAYRILPAFYAYIVVVTAFAAVGFIAVSKLDLAFAYAYLSNFRPGQFHMLGHLWSLSVEEQFYLAWPPIMVFTVGRTRNILLAISLLIAPVLRCGFSLSPRLAPFTDQSSLTICDVLAVGCLLAVYREKLHTLPAYRALLTRRGVAVIVIFCAVLLETSKYSSYTFQLTQSLLNIALAILIDACILLQPRLLNGPRIMLVGAWSYSIYLWQQLFCTSTGHLWNLFPINIMISIAIAYCSYRWIEQPVLRLRKKRKEHGAGILPVRGLEFVGDISRSS